MNSVPDAFGIIDGHTHVGVDQLFYLRGHYPYAQDWPSLVEMGRQSGIERFVVFPMVSHLALNLAGLRDGKITSDGGLDKVPYAFENRRHMLEIERRFPEHRDHALPLWMIDPSREQRSQVEALRALSDEFVCCGLKVQATIIQSFVRDLLGVGECLLDLAEERGWPLLIHSSVHPEDPWSQARDILEVAKARPGVRFCVAHSCRFDLASLDEVATLANTWFDCSAHRIHCRLAIENHPAVAPSDQRFPSDYRDPTRVLHDLAEKYPAKMIWGSDAPFYSYVDENLALRSSYKEEADVLHQLSVSLLQRVANLNTLKFLALPNERH